METFTVWITAGPTPRGLKRVVALWDQADPDVIRWEDSETGTHYSFTEGVDWHRSRESALIRAEAIRLDFWGALSGNWLPLRRLMLKPFSHQTNRQKTNEFVRLHS